MDPRPPVHAGVGFVRRAFLIGPGGQATLAPPTNRPDLTPGDPPTIVDGEDSNLSPFIDPNEGQRPPTIPPQIPFNFHSVANEAPTQIASTATQDAPSVPFRPGMLGMTATNTAVAGISASVSSAALPDVLILMNNLVPSSCADHHPHHPSSFCNPPNLPSPHR